MIQKFKLLFQFALLGFSVHCASAATLNGSFVSYADGTNAVDLTVEGVLDWAHWGLYYETSFTHKNGVSSQISDYSIIGSDIPNYAYTYTYTDDTNACSWSDGYPILARTNTTTGIYAAGVGSGFGFTFTVPADTTLRTLKVYVGASDAAGRFKAFFLNDPSVPPYNDISIDNTGVGPGGVYTVDYATTSTNKTLVIQYTVAYLNQPASGNITLQAATLSGNNFPPTVAITNLTNNSVFTGPTNILIQTAPSDPDGTIAKVEILNGTNLLSTLTNSPFNFTWTNVARGNYALVAKATDDKAATFTSKPIAVFVGTNGGRLTAGVASSPSIVNLSDEAGVDWIHWGRSNSFNPTFLDDVTDRKAGVTPSLSQVTLLGGATPTRYTDSPRYCSWTDGTPFPESTNRTGIYMTNLGNGFQITAPADPGLRRLKVYVECYAAQGSFQATLSDFTAPTFNDTSMSNILNTTTKVYSIDYSSATPGQSLIVKFTSSLIYEKNYGNVALQAVTLGPPVRFINPTLSGNTFSASVLSETGFTYVVEYSNSLSPASWQTLQTLPGTGSSLPINDTNLSGFSRFYRIRLQ